jgi:glyoxalase family protein
MDKLVTGIHHITALTSDAQRNVDFYEGILGLRLVKKTINFDAPEIYHLYYDNENGDPGSCGNIPVEFAIKGFYGITKVFLM